MKRSDAELIQGILDRDAGAFDALYERHAEGIRRRLLRIVRTDSVAQDLVQEAFLRVWTRAEQWEGRGSLAAWLVRLATNLALNHLRSVRRRKERPLEIPKEADASEEDEEPHVPSWMVDASALGADALAAMQEQRETVRRLVDRLPEEQREVVRLVMDAEMDIRGVADQLGIPEGTVKSRLHYARKRLGREWKDTEEEREEG